MKYYRDNLFNELIVDNFAGGGGAYAGAFYFDCNYSASYADSYVGARLCFCGKE